MTNVVSGEHNRLEQEGTEQNHDGVKIKRPDRPDKDGRDDIALVKLKTSIKQTAYAHAVCYDEDPASSLIWPTEYGVVTGWGSRRQVKIFHIVFSHNLPWILNSTINAEIVIRADFLDFNVLVEEDAEVSPSTDVTLKQSQ